MPLKEAALAESNHGAYCWLRLFGGIGRDLVPARLAPPSRVRTRAWLSRTLLLVTASIWPLFGVLGPLLTPKAASDNQS